MKIINNRQLLCTFSNKKEFEDVVEEIKKFYSTIPIRFFVFSNEKKEEEVYITYNIPGFSDEKQDRFPNTISVHRKKQTNTIYSINALNQIIRDENDGEFVKNYQVNWEYYQNSLILKNEVSIKIIPLKILTIIS